MKLKHDKIVVYRQGSQFTGGLYLGNRENALATVAKLTPFVEEIIENNIPIGFMGYNPMKTETETSDTEVDFYDPAFVANAKIPNGEPFKTWAPTG